jgi:cytochrome P450
MTEYTLGPDDFDPRDPGFQTNPYPSYRRMREERPVHFRRDASGFEMWHCFRHEDISEMLRSSDCGSVSIAPEMIEQVLATPDSPFHALARIVSSVMLIKDGEDHHRLRGLVNKAFTPRMVEGLRPRIERIVEELLDAIEPRGEMDLLTDFAAPLPIIVIAELLGIPPEDRVQLRSWSDTMATFIDGTIRDAGMVAAATAAAEMASYLELIFEQRRAEPRDDLISGLVQARESADRLSEDELLATVGLILGAGHETTTNLIGNGTLALLRHPDQLEALRSDPEQIRGAVEELLRYDSPVQTTSRVPTRDIELGGELIRAGTEVGLYLGAANHDPAIYADPGRLDIQRVENPHLSFGHGVHFCLGAALARLEGQLAIGRLVTRLPNMKVSTETLSWRPGVVLRGLRELPLRF